MKQLLAEHPKRMNFILNGLGYIKTNDVRLPESAPSAAAAPVAAKAASKPVASEDFPELPKKVVVEPPTEQEIAELEQAIEVDFWNQPYRNILNELSYEHRMYLLRQEFMPFIHAEMDVAWASNVPIYMDMAEQIFFRLNELDEDDIAMCLEDNTILVENIRQLITEAPIPDPDCF